MHTKTYKDYREAEVASRRLLGKPRWVPDGDPDPETGQRDGHYVVQQFRQGSQRFLDRKEQVDSIEHLLEVLKPGTTVYTCLRQRSPSGMSRHISLHVVEDGEVRDITRWVARVLRDRVSDKTGGLVVGGAGMDMGFHVVYNLGSVLYPAGFTCPGKGCPSNEHVNSPRPAPRKGRKHTGDGGYALAHQWL